MAASRPVLGIAAALGLLAGAGGLEAQTYQGVVVEAGSGDPIEGAVVLGSPGNYVDVTEADGVFLFMVSDRHRPLTLEVSRQGYRSATLVVDEVDRDLVIELEIAPVELEGITTRATFEARMEEVQLELDERYATHRGVFRRLDAPALRTFDEAYEGEPYAMLSGGLDLFSDIRATSDVLRAQFGRPLAFEVFVDDVRVPLTAMLDVPNEQLCRAEMFHKVRTISTEPMNTPTPQLRVYTCSLLARAAEGEEMFEDRLCWNRLVAWRSPSVGPMQCTYRRGGDRPR